jgi:hypothetical protein
MPQLVHTMRSPNAGTGLWSGQLSALSTAHDGIANMTPRAAARRWRACCRASWRPGNMLRPLYRGRTYREKDGPDRGLSSRTTLYPTITLSERLLDLLATNESSLDFVAIEQHDVLFVCRTNARRDVETESLESIEESARGTRIEMELP